MKKKKNEFFSIKRCALTFLLSTVAVATIWAQDRTVSGVVKEPSGDPAIGVSVYVKGTTTGTITGTDGSYTLTVPANAKTLVFKYVGMVDKEVSITGNRIDVTLVEDTKVLEDVVVVGYGTVKKRDVTGAITAVGEQQLLKTPSATIEQALQGNAPGALVMTTTAEPGADVTIRIRGSASINGGNDPLFVIDNIPSTKEQFSMLNPLTIQSINILKDAAATAIYGSRAANGVVMVTTKSGEKGKVQISVNANYGFNILQNVMDVMNGYQFAKFSNMSYYARGVNSLAYSPELDNISSIDFQKMFTRNGNRKEATIQLSGGNDKTTYFISTSYLNQVGLLLNTGITQFSFQSNLTTQLKDNLKFTLNASAFQRTRQYIGGGSSSGGSSGGDNGAMFRTASIKPTTTSVIGAELSDNGWFIDPVTGERFYISDVLVNTLATQIYAKPFNLNLKGQLDWDIIPGLTATVRGGITYGYQTNYQYSPRDAQISTANVTKNNKAIRGESNSINWVNENFLTYKKTFGGKHNLNLLLGQSAQRNTSEGFGVTVTQFETDDYGWNNLGAAIIMPAASDLTTTVGMYALVSVYGSAAYNYDERYYATATFRTDGSSRFGPDYKWGSFPSIALAWNVKNEEFLKESNALSRLKLRATWGVTGNDNISQGASISLVTDGKVILNNVQNSATYVSQMGNGKIRWETTSQYNVGVDVGLLRDRIAFSLDAYYKRTSNLLYNKALPLTTGFSSITSNVGIVDNKGLEFDITTHNIQSKNFRWTTNLNVSYNQNKVVDLGGDDIVGIYAPGGNMKVGSGVNVLYLKVGEPMSVFKGYKTTLWKDWNEIYSAPPNSSIETTLKIIPGMLRYWGSGPGGSLTDMMSDIVTLGHTIPDVTGGFTNTFSYRDFDLTVFFTGAFGNTIFNGNSGKLFNFQGNVNNQFVKSLECDRPMNIMTGDAGYSGKYPVPIPNKANALSEPIAYTVYMNNTFLEDGSFLRLKSLALNYNLPKKVCGLLGIQNFSVNFTAMNLWTLTSYSGMDPEMSSTQGNNNNRIGVDQSAYPASRTYTFGFNLVF